MDMFLEYAGYALCILAGGISFATIVWAMSNFD